MFKGARNSLHLGPRVNSVSVVSFNDRGFDVMNVSPPSSNTWTLQYHLVFTCLVEVFLSKMCRCCSGGVFGARVTFLLWCSRRVPEKIEGMEKGKNDNLMVAKTQEHVFFCCRILLKIHLNMKHSSFCTDKKTTRRTPYTLGLVGFFSPSWSYLQVDAWESIAKANLNLGSCEEWRVMIRWGLGLDLGW